MTMTGRSGISSSVFLALFGFALFVVVVFFAVGFQSPIRAFFAGLLSSKNGSPYESLSRHEIEERLQAAEAELTRSTYQSVLYGLLADENKKLRAVSSVDTITTAVTARVISRPPRTHYDTLLIASGSASGIRVHDTVVANGVLLGEVISVTASSATVELFSTPKSEHDVILGVPTAVAIASGVGGGAFEVLVPQSVSIFQGDSVRAASDETLILGIVASVSGSATDATKTVRISAPISMSDLDFVSVVPQGDL